LDLAIDNTLVSAYQNAEYVVFADTEFVMLVAKYSQALHQTMTKKQFTQAAFISAYNPYSEILEEPENLTRHSALSEELSDLGLSFIEGLGRDKEGQWPGEKSVLVLNISNDCARMLGNKYGQNAILWIGEGAIPQLLLLEGKSG
jgi:hypothetical protein